LRGGRDVNKVENFETKKKVENIELKDIEPELDFAPLSYLTL